MIEFFTRKSITMCRSFGLMFVFWKFSIVAARLTAPFFALSIIKSFFSFL